MSYKIRSMIFCLAMMLLMWEGIKLPSLQPTTHHVDASKARSLIECPPYNQSHFQALEQPNTPWHRNERPPWWAYIFEDNLDRRPREIRVTIGQPSLTGNISMMHLKSSLEHIKADRRKVTVRCCFKKCIWHVHAYIDKDAKSFSLRKSCSNHTFNLPGLEKNHRQSRSS